MRPLSRFRSVPGENRSRNLSLLSLVEAFTVGTTSRGHRALTKASSSVNDECSPVGKSSLSHFSSMAWRLISTQVLTVGHSISSGDLHFQPNRAPARRGDTPNRYTLMKRRPAARLRVQQLLELAVWPLLVAVSPSRLVDAGRRAAHQTLT